MIGTNRIGQINPAGGNILRNLLFSPGQQQQGSGLDPRLTEAFRALGLF